jgi:hypothetical protein
MIRHVATITFRPGTTDGDIDAFTEAFLALRVEGMLALSGGRRPDLREGDADYAIVVDFEDAAAFWRYDRDPAHERLRAGLAARIIDRGQASQYVL